jgi:hypothetical protein
MKDKKMQTRENEGILMQRIRNQLRIHWHWLRQKEDYNDAADFIDGCIRQAMSYRGENERKNYNSR